MTRKVTPDGASGAYKQRARPQKLSPTVDKQSAKRRRWVPGSLKKMWGRGRGEGCRGDLGGGWGVRIAPATSESAVEG